MENNLKFNSAICTSRSQSERLLSLGLKKETSDMKYVGLCRNEDGSILFQKIPICKGVITENNIDIPAWSLHRLMCLVFNSGATHVELFEDDDAYEILMYKIEMRIKEGYFNKEYLV